VTDLHALVDEIERLRSTPTPADERAEGVWDRFLAIATNCGPEIGLHLGRVAHARVPEAAATPDDARPGISIDPPEAHRRLVGAIIAELVRGLRPALADPVSIFPRGDATAEVVAEDIESGRRPWALPIRPREVGAAAHQLRSMRPAAALQLFEIVHYEAARRAVSIRHCISLVSGGSDPGEGTLSLAHWKRISAEVGGRLGEASTLRWKASLRAQARAENAPEHAALPHVGELLNVLAG
jgi:hypothetical protein